MKYQFLLNSTIEHSVKRIAREIVTGAIADSKSPKLRDYEKIHEVRKKCKRMRGLLRIVRPQIGGTYKKENIFFRDLARKLSVARDQHVILESLEKLMKIERNSKLSKQVKNIISFEKPKTDSEKNLQLLSEFEKSIIESLSRINNWKVSLNGFKAVKGRFSKNLQTRKNRNEISI